MSGLVPKSLESCERVANKFLHSGANYTYMYNLHTVCKSAHVNGALLCVNFSWHIIILIQSYKEFEFIMPNLKFQNLRLERRQSSR